MRRPEREHTASGGLGSRPKTRLQKEQFQPGRHAAHGPRRYQHSTAERFHFGWQRDRFVVGIAVRARPSGLSILPRTELHNYAAADRLLRSDDSAVRRGLSECVMPRGKAMLRRRVRRRRRAVRGARSRFRKCPARAPRANGGAQLQQRNRLQFLPCIGERHFIAAACAHAVTGPDRDDVLHACATGVVPNANSNRHAVQLRPPPRW